MEALTDSLAEYAQAAGRSEAMHKAGYAKAFLEEEGPEYKRVQAATLRTHKLFLKRKADEAVYQATKEALSTLRAQIDALRTISANLRQQT